MKRFIATVALVLFSASSIQAQDTPTNKPNIESPKPQVVAAPQPAKVETSKSALPTPHEIDRAKNAATRAMMEAQGRIPSSTNTASKK